MGNCCRALGCAGRPCQTTCPTMTTVLAGVAVSVTVAVAVGVSLGAGVGVLVSVSVGVLVLVVEGTAVGVAIGGAPQLPKLAFIRLKSPTLIEPSSLKSARTSNVGS